MKKKINSNTTYWYLPKQKKYFKKVEALLNQGYQITDSIHLGVELSKDEKSHFLTFLPLEEINENFKETWKSKEVTRKLVKPNYEHCFLNTISSIRAYFNKEIYYCKDPLMDEILEEKQYKNIIVLLLDGLGENILEEHLKPTDFLRKNHAYTNTAIFPSTTAAATTSIISGHAPLETGWLGWENYFKECGKNIILFRGTDYFTDKKTEIDAYKLMPYTRFFDDLDVCGKQIMPDFNWGADPYISLDKSLKSLEAGKINVQYVYCTEPDSTMHEFGTDSEETKKRVCELNQKVEEYVNALPSDTLCIITADHGHTNVTPIDFYNCKLLNKMLVHRPANDSRAITFTVKENYKEEFYHLFKSLFGYAYDIYPSKELIENGFFGPNLNVIHERVPDFLGDFMAIAKSEYYFNYKNKDSFIMKSQHAGYTLEEMLVPMIICRK
ncbi:MAG: alkaline phosphatase family protein [Anaeroplasmataceae bacterium]|nr:alkaline phosphatase family protein [Anaeroplasmataceae bacterium]